MERAHNPPPAGSFLPFNPIILLMDVAKRWLLILLLAVTAGTATLAFAAITCVPVYEAKATFAVTLSEHPASPYSDLAATSGLAKVAADLLNDPILHKKVLGHTDLPDFDGTIHAVAIPETNLLTLTVTAADPDSAHRVAEGIITHHGELTDQIIDRLLLEILQQPTVPTEPSDPVNAVGSALRAALLAAAATAAILAYLSARKHSGTEIRGKRNGASPTESKDSEIQKLDLPILLGDCLQLAKRFIPLALVLMLVCSGIFTAWAFLGHTPIYTASAAFSLKIDDPQYPNSLKTAEQVYKSFSRIVSSDVLRSRVREDLGTDSLGRISVSANASSSIITLCVEARNPQQASDQLDAVLDCYPEVAEWVIGPTVLTLLDETGVPTEPSNPLTLTDPIGTGLTVGIGLWLAFILSLAISGSTARKEAEISY